MNNIGTINEKSIHRYLKYILEPNEIYHEIKVGNYIADIKKDNKIIEIQPKQFKNLINKIEYYLKLDGTIIEIVYPVVVNKYINWIDVNTHEVIERRKSTKVGNITDIFKELYYIKNYIGKNKFILTIIELDAEEYKYLDGYGINNKNKATKIDIVPTSIINKIQIRNIEDLKVFIPNTLGSEWLVKEYIKEMKIHNKKWVNNGIKILREKNIIEVTRKQRNAYVYCMKK